MRKRILYISDQRVNSKREREGERNFAKQLSAILFVFVVVVVARKNAPSPVVVVHTVHLRLLLFLVYLHTSKCLQHIPMCIYYLTIIHTRLHHI